MSVYNPRDKIIHIVGNWVTQDTLTLPRRFYYHRKTRRRVQPESVLSTLTPPQLKSCRSREVDQFLSLSTGDCRPRPSTVPYLSRRDTSSIRKFPFVETEKFVRERRRKGTVDESGTVRFGGTSKEGCER